MKTRRNLITLFLSVILIFNASCSAARPTEVSGTGNHPENAPAAQVPEIPTDAPVAEAPELEESDEDAVARIVEGPLAQPEIEYPALGSIRFELDPAASVTAEYSPESETVLKLTDAAGITWTLTIPMHALAAPQQITMTALSDPTSEDVPGSLVGGIRLEPDGLEFLNSGVLAVSGEDAAGKPFLLTGQNDGTGVEVAYMEETPGAASISHFSTVFLSRVEQEQVMEEMFSKLNDSEKALIREAKELLKNKEIKVPTPPSVPLECTSDAEAKEYAKLVENFVAEVYKPEGELIGKLLAIKHGKALLSREYDSMFTLENRLLTRVVKKVRLLITTYHGQEEKLDAVSTAALSVAKAVALLSDSPEGTTPVLFSEEISSWAASLIDGLLEDIRAQHDYRKVSAVMKLVYWTHLLGSNQQSYEEIEARLERVFQFEMELEWEMGIVGESNYVVQGSFPMRYIAKEVPWGTLIGSGRAEMVSAKFESDEDWYVVSAPFQVNAIITGFDVCGTTAYLTVDRFYPNQEDHFTLDSDGEVMEIGSMPLMQLAWETLYEDLKQSGPAWFAGGETSDRYTFQLNLRNKDETAVLDLIETIDPHPDGDLSGWLDVKLWHRPK